MGDEMLYKCYPKSLFHAEEVAGTAYSSINKAIIPFQLGLAAFCRTTAIRIVQRKESIITGNCTYRKTYKECVYMLSKNDFDYKDNEEVSVNISLNNCISDYTFICTL